MIKKNIKILLLIFLSSSVANAQGFLSCDIPLQNNKFHLENSINFEADNIFVGRDDDLTTELVGNVRIIGADSTTSSENATYNQSTESLTLEGGVNFEQNNVSINSEIADFSYLTETFSFSNASFILNDNNSRGDAEKIQINSDGVLNLNNVSYTTCPVTDNGWLIRADKITLNLDKGEASAKKLGLKFKGFPLLYVPRISFPINTARKSGFLAPEIGGGGRSGNELRAPFYINIAKNYDATITPRILTGRGFQLGSEFRYLDKNNSTTLQFDYLEDDNIFGKSRYFKKIDHETIFNNGIRARIDYGDTSDGNYFEDLGRNLSLTSITHLNRSLILDAYGENWSIFSRFQNFQTIDDAITQGNRPYHRLPQIKIWATHPRQPLGIRASIDTELVYFDREYGVTGWRIDNEPKLSWEIRNDGWYVKPSLSIKSTQYQLKNNSNEMDKTISRTLPISSIDAGLFFERSLRTNTNLIQTLEPRIMYLYAPYRDQSNVPIFDTIEPDMNIIQLFQKNRFLGIDRIADSNQINLGFSSKISNKRTGNELISATLGKAFYLENQKVSLPGTYNNIDSSSDYIAEVRLALINNLNFNFSHQWNDDQTGVARSQAKLQYRPSEDKLFNIGYRFREDLLEQGNISWSFPLSETWNFLGHYNYSLRDKRTLEQFYGIEYESCCWGIRLVYRDYVSTRDGQEDSSIGIQFILKGMTSIGTNANKLLERGILGYSSDSIQ